MQILVIQGNQASDVDKACKGYPTCSRTMNVSLQLTPDWNLNASIRFCASCAILCNILTSRYIKMSVHLYLLSVDRGFLSYYLS